MSAARGTLVLAWGNPGRLDDGLGPALAAIVELERLPEVGVTSVYQLQIEHAASVASHRRVVFVDADRTGAGPFRVERLVPDQAAPRFTTHSVAPGAVLALARELYGAEPEAWLVAVRGDEFDAFGERLSARARANLALAAAFVLSGLRAGEFHECRPAPRGEPCPATSP